VNPQESEATDPARGIVSQPDRAELTPPAESPAQARAIWTQQPPAGPWCPVEWQQYLHEASPGLRPPEASQSDAECTGTGVRAANWSLTLASRRGRLHAHRGEHREDAGELLTFAGGWVAAVGDGAGSATWSRLGSAIAVHTVTHAIREALAHGAAPEAALQSAMQHGAAKTNDAMRKFVERAGIALRDLRTTLLVVASHAGTIGTLQVGDGAIAIISSDGSARLPHAGDSGEFSGEVTHFLPDDGAAERLSASFVAQPLADVRAVLIASDGVDDPWYPFARHAPALFAQLHDGVTDANANAASVTQTLRGNVLHADDAVRALQQWLAFEKRGENDDRTLAVAWVSSPSV